MANIWERSRELRGVSAKDMTEFRQGIWHSFGKDMVQVQKGLWRSFIKEQDNLAEFKKRMW